MFTQIDIRKDGNNNYAVTSNGECAGIANAKFDSKNAVLIDTFYTDFQPSKIIDDTWKSLQKLRKIQNVFKGRFAVSVN